MLLWENAPGVSYFKVFFLETSTHPSSIFRFEDKPSSS